MQPAALQAVTVRVVTPSGRLPGQENVPLLLAVVWHTVSEPPGLLGSGRVMVICAPGEAVPVTGWVGGPGATGGSTTSEGRTGAVVLTQLVTLQAVTITLVRLGGSGPGQLKVPDWLAVVVHSVWPVGLVSVRATPGVAVPVMGPVGGTGSTTSVGGGTTVRVVG